MQIWHGICFRPSLLKYPATWLLTLSIMSITCSLSACSLNTSKTEFMNQEPRRSLTVALMTRCRSKAACFCFCTCIVNLHQLANFDLKILLGHYHSPLVLYLVDFLEKLESGKSLVYPSRKGIHCDEVVK